MRHLYSFSDMTFDKKKYTSSGQNLNLKLKLAILTLAL